MHLKQGPLVLVLLSKVIRHNYWHRFCEGVHNKQCNDLDKAPGASERMECFPLSAIQARAAAENAAH